MHVHLVRYVAVTVCNTLTNHELVLHVYLCFDYELNVSVASRNCRVHRQERANEEVEMAQLQGTPIRELMPARLSPSSGEPGGHSDVTGAIICPGSRQPRQWAPQSGSQLCKRSWYRRNSSDDEEEGVHSVTHSESRWSLSSETRDRSTSAWLHFPHVELVFLLFAFEGAIAAGVSALRESRCPWVLVAAATALVSLQHYA